MQLSRTCKANIKKKKPDVSWWCVGVRTRGSRHKLKEEMFRPDAKKNISIVRTARHWSRMPRELVQSPSLQAFKTGLDKFLSNLD